MLGNSSKNGGSELGGYTFSSFTGFSRINFNEYRIEGDKIHIHPSQLTITNEGIFIIVQGEHVLVHQLNCDENGIYCLMEHLDKITDECYNRHKIWCGRCGGCAVRWCKFRCKCVEWEYKSSV